MPKKELEPQKIKKKEEIEEFLSHFGSPIYAVTRSGWELNKEALIRRLSQYQRIFSSLYDENASRSYLYTPEDVSSLWGEIWKIRAVSFLYAIGCDTVVPLESKVGSFWQNIVSFFRKQLSPEEIDNYAEQGKRALQLKYVKLPTAEETKLLSEAAKNLLEHTKDRDNAVMMLGQILYLQKTDDGVSSVIALTLNDEQVKKIQNNPLILQDIKNLPQILSLQN